MLESNLDEILLMEDEISYNGIGSNTTVVHAALRQLSLNPAFGVSGRKPFPRLRQVLNVENIRLEKSIGSI